METFYIDTLGKINKDTTISLYSDFHINKNVDANRYTKVLNNLEKDNPNYIFILGDFIENPNISSSDIDCVYNYLCLLTSIAPIYYIYGNHELRTEINGEEITSINKDYFQMLKAVPKLKVLDNESVLLDENIGLTGVTLPFKYYVEDNENREAYLKYINDFLINNLLGNLNNNSFNILLQHSPNNILDKETYLKILAMIKQILNKDFNFELTILGHLHNGLIPVYLEKFLPGNKGIIGIKGNKRNLFQDNCRGSKNITDDTKAIILPAVSSLPYNPLINCFYPPGGKTLILKK